VGKCGAAGQVTGDNMAHAHRMLNIYGNKLKLRIRNPCSEFPVAVIGRIPSSITNNHISYTTNLASIRTDMPETSE
jgi:hypothetical protein